MRKHIRFILAAALGVAGVASLAISPAQALTPYDVPVVTCESATLSSITLNVCGGASGAPAGLTIQWKLKSDWETSGWADDGTLCKLSLSGQPSMQHPEKSRWELLPGECETVTIGDINFDETGVSGNCVDTLICGKDYVFRWFAHAGRGFGRSDWGGDLTCNTLPCPVTTKCTYTQGYWKNHGRGACVSGNNTDVWPASVRSGGMVLGTVHYTADQLCDIYQTPAGGNGLVSLAHQLITAKMNLANGASNCRELLQAISSADALIGGKVVPPVGTGSLKSGGQIGDLIKTLTAYNEGTLCGPHCEDRVQRNSAQPSMQTRWGELKIRYR